MKNIILNILQDSIEAKRRCIENSIDNIIKAADMLAACLTRGNKILIFGNGGSAADAQHLAAEFVNRFQIERPPLAAVALTTDTSILTSIGNDYQFDDIFSKQVEALGRPGDIAWGISTSGNSANVIQAIKAARKIGMSSIGMTGRAGELAGCVDLVFGVASDVTARIQESHITLGHIFCDLLERKLYPNEFRD
ncbi:MAG: D-sedoheptulose 7-phosphate isomerase [Deltaproteobacteria bacterium]|nr:D-sedoheptulose 7-phosphate isomerase [Deltaproteobacteria bacterium]